VKVSDVSVSRPVLITVIYLAIVIFGLYALRLLPLDFFPDVEPPVLSVITTYPGASAEEVEEKVTEVVEESLGALSDLEQITSTSKDNISAVTLQFEIGADLTEAANEVRQNLEFAKRMMPDEIDSPMLFKFDMAMFPVMLFGVVSSSGDVVEYRDLIEDRVLEPLKRVQGVGSVQVFNAPEEQVQIEIDRARLAAYNMTIAQVAGVIGLENFSIPAGRMDLGALEFPVRMPAEFETLEDMAGVVLARRGDRVVRLRDVADVQYGLAETTEEAAINGRECIFGGIMKRSGTNTVAVASAIQEKLAELQKTLPEHLELVVLVDTSRFIRIIISSLLTTLLVAGTLVVVVVWLFLRSWRSSVVVGLAIPSSMIIVFLMMYQWGYTLNVVTMIGMCLAIGMVVDNAIVVLENISRHVDEGKDGKTAAAVGTAEMAGAITASTLTTVSVFGPLVFAAGIVGVMLGQLAFVISITVGASLLVAVTLTPTFAARLVRPTAGTAEQKAGRLLSRLERGYRRLLVGTLNHRFLVVLVSAAIVGGTVLLVRAVGTEYIPEQNGGDVRIIAELPVGTRVDATTRVAKMITEEFAKQPEVEAIGFRAGTSSFGISAAMGGKEGSNVAEVSARLKPFSQREGRDDRGVGQHMRKFVEGIPEVETVTVETEAGMAGILIGTAKPVTLELLGHDPGDLRRAAEIVEKLVRSVPGTVDVTADLSESRPEIRYVFDRDRGSRLGVSAAAAGVALRSALAGQELNRFRGGSEDREIFIRLRGADREQTEDLAQVEVNTMMGQTVRLGDIGRFVEAESPIEVKRMDRQRVISVGANLLDRPLGDVAEDIEERLREVDLPASVVVRWGGDV